MPDSCLCWDKPIVEMKEEEKRVTYWKRSTGKGLGIAGKRDFKLREFRAAKNSENGRMYGQHLNGIYRPLEKFEI